MSNIIEVFMYIVVNYKTTIKDISDGNNRAKNMVESLESYIADAFSNNFNEQV